MSGPRMRQREKMVNLPGCGANGSEIRAHQMVPNKPTNKQINQTAGCIDLMQSSMLLCVMELQTKGDLCSSISALACSYVAASGDVKIKCKKKKPSDYNSLIDA